MIVILLCNIVVIAEWEYAGVRSRLGVVVKRAGFNQQIYWVLYARPVST